ncbi:hypothetical protein C5167_012980 [Papaver somniferum]|uniref:KIB1-4 beta-propeller domain-containing protein n=1 Tax=Papaver somniferum TaxID=3469 RepID=A0A4Y7IZ15_PAPSO|nr:hypothetical protein C5167_012980 [Papaver somniferum]
MEEPTASSESPDAVPWLVFPYGEDDNSMPNCKYGDCFLWNPLTLETIQLPSLLIWISFEPDGEYMLDCVLSSPPKTTLISTNIIKDVDSDDNDPLVLVLYQSMSELDTYTFLYCHPGEKKWRTQCFSEEISGHMCEIEFLHCFKGKLYALGINGDCLEIEKQHQVGASDNCVSLSMKSFEVIDRTYDPLHGAARDTCKCQRYFVEGHDDLFMIDANFHARGSETLITSICITRKNRICCSSARLGLARGCVYYTLPVHQLDEFHLPMGSQMSLADLGLYKFEVEDIGDYDISPCLRLQEPVFTPDWIMMPDGQRRKELDNLPTCCVFALFNLLLNIPYPYTEELCKNDGRTVRVLTTLRGVIRDAKSLYGAASGGCC